MVIAAIPAPSLNFTACPAAPYDVAVTTASRARSPRGSTRACRCFKMTGSTISPHMRQCMAEIPAPAFRIYDRRSRHTSGCYIAGNS